MRLAGRALALAAAGLAAACGGLKMPAMPSLPAMTPSPTGDASEVAPPARPVAAASAPAATAPKPATPAAWREPAALSAAQEKTAIEHIERIRATRPAANPKEAEQFNKQLEDAWKFFLAHPGSIAPIRRALSREMTQRPPNHFVLLDLGYYLHTHGSPADRELAKSALFTLDPAAPIMRFNLQELFQFTHVVAASRDERVLEFIERAFLRKQVAVEIPESKVTLDPTLATAWLYGAYGDGAEARLASLLRTPVTDKPLARKVLEVLTWIGSPASNPQVKNVLIGASRDADTFMRTATFLMNVGGPQGRAVVLAVQPDGLDLWTASYFERIREPARATSFASLSRPLTQDASLKKVLDADRPRAELIAQLDADRTRIFRLAPTKERVAEAQRVNLAINAIRYRDS
ncbi:MAG TPA: hypothetical protein VFD95_00125 [Usitatibacter sp.]|nr:hypothetical protein [Usitatibacter sp.]